MTHKVSTLKFNLDQGLIEGLCSNSFVITILLKNHTLYLLKDLIPMSVFITKLLLNDQVGPRIDRCKLDYTNIDCYKDICFINHLFGIKISLLVQLEFLGHVSKYLFGGRGFILFY